MKPVIRSVPRRARTPILLVVAAVALPLWISVCSSDSADPTGADSPDLERVAGSYLAGAAGPGGAFGAIVFTADSFDASRDLIADGASIGLELREDGTATGWLFIPVNVIGVPDYEADLAGTWSLEGNVVRLQHDADTFLRDMSFIFEDDRLQGEQQDSGVTVRVILARRTESRGDLSVADLNAARQRWQKQGMLDYDFTLRIDCFCGFAGRAHLAVRGGEIVSANDAATGEPISPEVAHFPTVEEIFDEIQRAIEGDADRLDVVFHADLGYPVLADIDPSFQIADEEVSYRIEALAPATPSSPADSTPSGS